MNFTTLIRLFDEVPKGWSVLSRHCRFRPAKTFALYLTVSVMYEEAFGSATADLCRAICASESRALIATS